MANLDEVFDTCLLEIDVQKQRFRKHDKIRIDQWIKKLKQVTTTIAKKDGIIFMRNISLVYYPHLLKYTNFVTIGECFTKRV